MKKNNIMKFGIVIGIILIIVIVIAIQNVKLQKNKNQITKYEWIQMLSEQFGINEYKNKTPYFKDVIQNNPYYDSIQSCYEWGVIETNEKFEGENPITGELAVLTAMRAIGKYKIQIYLGLDTEPTEIDYIELAKKEALISESQLRKGITREEGINILKQASELYTSKLWVDNYVKLQYQDNVKEIDPLEVLSINEDFSKIQIANVEVMELGIGDTIVFSNPSTGEKIAKNVNKINNDILELSDVSSGQVIESLVLSDITSISAEDIVSYYQLENKNDFEQSIVYSSVYDEAYEAKPMFSNEKDIPGFSVTLKTDDGTLNISMEDYNTGLVYELPVKESLGSEANVDVTIEVPKIDVGVQLISKEGINPEYIDARVESNIVCSGDVSVNTEKKIPLLKAPVFLGNMAVGIDLQFYIALSVDGSISIQAELPVQFSVIYEKGVGIRRHNEKYSSSDPVIQADCTAEISVGVVPTIKLFMVEILDIEGDIGVSVNANIKNRINSNIFACAEIGISFPIVSLQVATSEDINNFLDMLDLSISESFDIISADNAPIKKLLHYEWYTDETSRFVEKCSYQQKEKQEMRLIYDPPHHYFTYFNSDFKDRGDYYEVTGKVFDCAYIPAKIADNMGIGENYIYDNITFTCQERGEFEDGFKYIIMIDDQGNDFLVDTHSSIGSAMNEEKMVYYYYIDHVTLDKNSDYNGMTRTGENTVYYHTTGNFYIVVDDNYVFQFPKDSYVSIAGNESEINGANKGMHTMEEAVEKSIKDYRGYEFGKSRNWRMDIILGSEGDPSINPSRNTFPGEYYDLDRTIHLLSEMDN